jgi:DNA invertase Pin-like site-specific DNA recombinase
VRDPIATVGDRRRRGVGFTHLHENLDTTTRRRLTFHVFAALAELIRELIVSGARGGVAAARGRVGGRPAVGVPEIIRAAREVLSSPEASVAAIVRLPGAAPGTIDNHIPDLRARRT